MYTVARLVSYTRSLFPCSCSSYLSAMKACTQALFERKVFRETDCRRLPPTQPSMVAVLDPNMPY